MITITTTEALAEFCTRAQSAPYVTVDTEFLRERTYYAKLCLIQLALPGDAPEDAVLVDPIAGQLDMAPLYDLFRDENVVKVFHAARQDLEIFCVEGGVIPQPLFDTQVAAMVCGFGEQVGYETLVRKLARAQVDKTSRFTDWSRRPLSDAQKTYALADVTHLRVVYEELSSDPEEIRPAGLGRGRDGGAGRSRDLCDAPRGSLAEDPDPDPFGAVPRHRAASWRGSAKTMPGPATCRAAGSSRTTRCSRSPR